MASSWFYFPFFCKFCQLALLPFHFILFPLLTLQTHPNLAQLGSAWHPKTGLISQFFFRRAKNRLKNWTEINIFETVCILPTSTLTTPSANLQYSWSLHRNVKWNKENTVLWEDLKWFPSSTLKIELNHYFFTIVLPGILELHDFLFRKSMTFYQKLSYIEISTMQGLSVHYIHNPRLTVVVQQHPAYSI